MFKHHKEKKAEEAYEHQLARWQQLQSGYLEMLQFAQGPGGFTTDEIMLKAREHVVGTISNTSLVEDRRGRGTYTGGSHGVSFPIGSIGGRTVRYRVGATRGHYVQGELTPTAIDVGTTYITNQRAIFVGAKQTRECLFAKLIGCQHDDSGGTTILSVSNRQKPTTIYYGSGIAGWVDFRFELALAQFRGTVPQVVAELQSDLAAIEQQKPSPPTPS